MGCGSLYIHVPFCLGKCPYCDFYSVLYSEETADRFAHAVYRALKNPPYPVGPFATIYFGGGTPSLLGGRRIGALLHAAARHTILPGAEITVECNPSSVSMDNLAEMRAAGVNRLSMGVQSADDGLLRLLGRRHDGIQAARSAAMARAAGFEHLSFDLMLGLPGQGEEEVVRAIRFCRAQGAEHVSAYLLKIEPDTPFAKNGMAARCPDEDTQADLYLFAARALESHGFSQYEISNFARHGQISRHNCKYWDCAEYLGVGPSAHSFVGGRRFHFPRDLERFLTTKDVFSLCVDDGPGGGVEEYVMLRLRLSDGVEWEALERRFPGEKLRESLEETAQILDGTELIVCDERGIRLTTKGMLVSNSIISMLLPESREPVE